MQTGKRKVLFTSHLANFVKFNRPYMKWFQDQGWEVHYASLNEEEIPCCDKRFKVSFNRSPYNTDNIKAYKQLKKIIDMEQYDLIHCHTPMGGVVTRLAAIDARKRGTKVIYTAHGFHFFKGARLINNLIYKNVERSLARYTDMIITINREDYKAAARFRLPANGRVCLIPGVGVDTGKIINTKVDFAAKRKELGILENSIVILTVAELIKRKDYKTALKAFAKAANADTVFLICGRGVLEIKLKELAKSLGISDRVIFAGYRKDIAEIAHISDVFLFTSRQEGLPVSVIEGMCAGLPVIASKIRGVTDFAVNGETGFLCPPGDIDAFAEAISELVQDRSLREKMGQHNLTVAKRFDIKESMRVMEEIYFKTM